MTTKGIIRRLNTDTDNHFLVYIPLLQKANDKEINATLPATLISIRGIEKTLRVGDVVYVTFEDERLDKPVIIGKLYLGAEDSSSIDTSISAKSLLVNTTTKLENSADITGLNLNTINTNLRKILDQNYIDSEDIQYNNIKVTTLPTESGEEVIPLESSILQDAIDEILKRLAGTSADIDPLKRRVSSLETDVSNLTLDLNNLSLGVSNLTGRVTTLENERVQIFDLRQGESGE